MGRRFRRFSFRVGVAAGVLGVGWFVHHRWGLRAAGAHIHVPLPDTWHTATAAERRCSHREAFAQSMRRRPGDGCEPTDTATGPFDVLVVGGGATGLYTAVDAAQRGLKVALVEAVDFGCGSTGTQPVLAPGAFPYVQRAIRQRDSRWLRRAYDTLENATIWHNTAPHCMMLAASPSTSAANTDTAPTATVTRARTLMPALHTAELLELTVTAWLSTLMSLLCGPVRLCTSLRSSSMVNRELPRLQGKDGGGAACGAVVVHDFLLDGTKAAVSLARTAEALGVSMLNYAELTALTYEDASPTAAAAGASASPLVVAEVLDHVSRSTLHLRTRGVVNCAGAGADTVKACVPGNALDAVPSVFDRFHVYSYLVVPRSALYRTGGESERSASSPSQPFVDRIRKGEEEEEGGRTNDDSGRQGPRTFRWLAKPGAALQVASTLYSFSAMLVTPWHDDTVLLGPSITPLAAAPGQHRQPKGRKDSASGAGPHEWRASALATFHSPDGYQAQREHIVRALASCGVGVHIDQVLSCLSSVVPLTKSPQQQQQQQVTSFAENIFVKGYHIHTFLANEDNAGGHAEEGHRPAGGAAPPFVHVYGGTSLAARRIAEEAVDTLIHKTTAFTDEYKQARGKQLTRCQTRWLRLAEVPYDKHGIGEDTAAVARLDSMVRDAYVARLTDVLARRLHVAYTSPAEAIQALPGLGQHVGAALGWSPAAAKEEVRLAKRFVEGVAVQQHPAPTAKVT